MSETTNNAKITEKEFIGLRDAATVLRKRAWSLDRPNEFSRALHAADEVDQIARLLGEFGIARRDEL